MGNLPFDEEFSFEEKDDLRSQWGLPDEESLDGVSAEGAMFWRGMVESSVAKSVHFDQGTAFKAKTNVDFWSGEEPSLEELYWSEALALIATWADYQAKKKLFINATHAETSHKVSHVIAKYYNGGLEGVSRCKKELSLKVDESLEKFKKISEALGLEPVSRDWLYHNLKNSSDYESLKRKCRRRFLAAKPPESLKTLVRG